MLKSCIQIANFATEVFHIVIFVSMAPQRKSRSVTKRYSTLNEVSPEKDGHSNKSKQRKKKLSDKLGSQWRKEELRCFYEAYRKYGKDWKKVSGEVRNRSAEMVEALFNMNRAYLSLPDGTASIVGLIAMMEDHYNVLEGSDSDQESNDASGISKKPQKRKRGKEHNISRDPSQSHDSSNGCLSLLKMKRFDGSQPRVVGKRTPRFPVKKDYAENYVSPVKKGRKTGNDKVDEVEHVAALALTEASQRGGSPQVSQAPYRRAAHVKSSSVRSWGRMHPQPEAARVKLHDSFIKDNRYEGSIGSRGTESGDYGNDTRSLLVMEDVGTFEVHRRGKKFHRKKEKFEDINDNQFDDGEEACSGTEEGLSASSLKGKVDVSNAKAERFSAAGQRKKSKKQFFGDELNALQTLADLSLMPETTLESESSVQLKEEKTTFDTEDKCSPPEATSTSQSQNRNKFLGEKHKVPQSISGVETTSSRKSKLGRDSSVDINIIPEAELLLPSPTKACKRKRKSLVPKISRDEANMVSHVAEPLKIEAFSTEENKPTSRGKRAGQLATISKQWKTVRSSEGSLNSDCKRIGIDLKVSTAQVPDTSLVKLPTKRSKRKMYLPRSLPIKDMKSSENICQGQLHKYFTSMKEKLSCCLSSYLVRRWCTFEWFYSAIDYPWFAKREFDEYLNHVGLGHIPRLTRVEWGVIRSSLGKPRRFSEHFLREEREKLKQYRELVREHYSEFRTGAREGLPTDLAKPLSVGQRVAAIHPITREVHDGSVLTVDHDRCRVQFDSPEIGVEFVMDIDCMPLIPLDNMPEALRRDDIALENFSSTPKEPQMHNNLNFGETMMFSSSGHRERTPNSMNAMIKHGKDDTAHSLSQLNGAAVDVGGTLQKSYSQPSMVANSQARGADIRALSEMTRALDKKEALLMELRNTNNEIVENQNGGDSSFNDSEPLKKHYATVLVQLKEASGKVSSALLNLRQRNTYAGNPLFSWLKPLANIHGGLPSSFDSFSVCQEPGSNVVEIVDGSRSKAHTMVDAAIQAFTSRKEGEDVFSRIREVLDSIDNKPMASHSRLPVNRSQEQGNGNLGNRSQLTSPAQEPLLTSNSSGSTLHTGPDKFEAQIPSELITTCVSSLLMIQTCTERQYPPADVAQILDSAMTSLYPCCPQNLQIYREIQTYMGRIKTQILALVPT